MSRYYRINKGPVLLLYMFDNAYMAVWREIYLIFFLIERERACSPRGAEGSAGVVIAIEATVWAGLRKVTRL